MEDERKSGAKPHLSGTRVAGGSEPRPPLTLAELLEILVKDELLSAVQAKDIEGRAITLRSRVVKERVGSVRSQAAARYNASPAEIVAAAALPHPTKPRKRVFSSRKGPFIFCTAPLRRSDQHDSRARGKGMGKTSDFCEKFISLPRNWSGGLFFCLYSFIEYN